MLHRAGKLQYGDIPALEKQLSSPEGPSVCACTCDGVALVTGLLLQNEKRLLSDAVTASDIAAIVSRATGIPVHDMLRGERDKLLHMEGLCIS